MNRKQLVRKISKACDLTTTQTDIVISCLVECIKLELESEGIVRLIGFGTFSVVKSKKKNARNIKTGEPMVIPPTKRVKFSTHESFKKELK